MIEISDSAVLDDKQRRVIAKIEPFTTGLDLRVTRGHSTPLSQLSTIAKLAKEYKVSFPEFSQDNVDEMVEVPGVGLVYRWQRTHSRLLHIGVIVNPPRTCTILESYVRPTGEEMLGKLMDPSPHITSDPIDFSQKVNGVPNIKLAARILTRAKAAGAGIKYVKIENVNGCCHCDLERTA
ncbi:MAG: hypothetical protein AABZ15_11735 [Nitrospirota bacterium]